MFQPRLLRIMQRELQAQNLQISPYGRQQIEQLVSQGVQRMRISKALDHTGHVMQAERNLKFLIRYFSDYARDAGTFPKLNDSDFDAALIACPTFWPYRSSS